MPLWQILHPEGTFTELSEREALSKRITKIYTDGGMPAFYVAIFFRSYPTGTIFRGGEVQPSTTRPPFIRITYDHIARKMPEGKNERKDRFFANVEEAIAPFVKDKGYDWEHHGVETDITMARIQGFEFPSAFSALEKYWVEINEPKPLPAGEQP